MPVMPVAEAELADYLAEIRTSVCSRCVERPPGGPPCAPLGKDCGVELHLPQLIDSIHQVHSNLLEPYLDHNRKAICEKCAFLHSSICPCPMDYLSALIVQAVETVDNQGRGEKQEKRFSLPETISLEDIHQAFEQAAGTWTGCDWPTYFGKTGLDLKGWTAARAAAMAMETLVTEEAQDWAAAVTWLEQVEHHARLAEGKAAAAVEAAAAGQWEEALHLADWAWALEFSTGRPLRHGFPLTWQRLRQRIEAAYLTSGTSGK